MFPSRKVNLFSINSDFGYSFLFLRLKTPILLAKNFIFKNLGCFWTLRNKCSFMYKRYFLLQPFDLQLKHLTEISIRNRKVGKKKPQTDGNHDWYCKIYFACIFIFWCMCICLYMGTITNVNVCECIQICIHMLNYISRNKLDFVFLCYTFLKCLYNNKCI